MKESGKNTPFSWANGMLVVLFNKMWKTNEGAGFGVCVCNRVLLRHLENTQGEMSSRGLQEQAVRW